MAAGSTPIRVLLGCLLPTVAGSMRPEWL